MSLRKQTNARLPSSTRLVFARLETASVWNPGWQATLETKPYQTPFGVPERNFNGLLGSQIRPKIDSLRCRKSSYLQPSCKWIRIPVPWWVFPSRIIKSDPRCIMLEGRARQAHPETFDPLCCHKRHLRWPHVERRPLYRIRRHRHPRPLPPTPAPCHSPSPCSPRSPFPCPPRSPSPCTPSLHAPPPAHTPRHPPFHLPSTFPPRGAPRSILKIGGTVLALPDRLSARFLPAKRKNRAENRSGRAKTGPPI